MHTGIYDYNYDLLFHNFVFNILTDEDISLATAHIHPTLPNKLKKYPGYQYEHIFHNTQNNIFLKFIDVKYEPPTLKKL